MNAVNWHCADRAYRAAIDVGEKPADGPAPVAVGAPLEAGLEKLGAMGPPDPQSCLVVPPGGTEADTRRAALFFADSPHEQNNSLAFEVRAGESGTFFLYFNALEEDAPMTVGTYSLGGGEPLVARDTPADAGFSSRPYPIWWARDGRMDLLVQGTASGRTFLYYAHNMGSEEEVRLAPLRPLRADAEWMAVDDAVPVEWDGHPALLCAVAGRGLAVRQVVGWQAGPVLGPAQDVKGFERSEVAVLEVLPRDGRWDLIVGLGPRQEAQFYLCRDQAESGPPQLGEPVLLEYEVLQEGPLPMERRPFLSSHRAVAALPYSEGGGASGFTLYLGEGLELVQSKTVGPVRPGQKVVMTDPRKVTDAAGHPVPAGLRDWVFQPAPVHRGEGRAPGLIIGSHTGSIYDMRNRGTLAHPVWEPATPVQYDLGPLNCSNFAAPAAADWCGDGRLSLVVGDEYGRLLAYRNAGTLEEPVFECCGSILADGGPVYFPGADLQGNDDFWGYTCPIAVDWNGDGRPDLIVAESRGYLTYFPNRSEQGPFHFGPGVLVELNGARFHSAWRVRPAIWQVGERLDLVGSDEQGLAWRFFDSGNRERPVFEGGELLRLETGRHMRPFLEHGRNPWGGRTRYAAVDWQGRGIADLILTNNEGGELSSGLLHYVNLGTNEEPLFRRGEHLKASGWEVRLDSGHAVIPCFVDWFGEGRPDVLIGADEGTIHLYRRSAFDVAERPRCGEVEQRG